MRRDDGGGPDEDLAEGIVAALLSSKARLGAADAPIDSGDLVAYGGLEGFELCGSA